MDPVKKKRFLWGALLAWIPWLPTIITFRGILADQATGLPTVAGTLAETFTLIGLLATVAFEVAAIMFLFRAFERGHRLRSLFSAFSICIGAVMLLLLGLFVWLSWSRMHPAT
jgi:hypothetical protein